MNSIKSLEWVSAVGFQREEAWVKSTMIATGSTLPVFATERVKMRTGDLGGVQ